MRRGEVFPIFLAAMLLASPLAGFVEPVLAAMIGGGVGSIALEILEGLRRRRHEQREQLTDVFR